MSETSTRIVACPAEAACGPLSVLVGAISSHLVDEHGWSKVGAQAAENQARREAGAPEPKPAAGTPREPGVRHCSICGRAGTRRDKCPDRNRHAELVRDANQAGAHHERPAELDDVDRRADVTESDIEGDRPLYRVGRLIDRLRDAAAVFTEAADELDALVADGIIP